MGTVAVVLAGTPRTPCHSRSCSTTRSTISRPISRAVVSLPPAAVIMPPGPSVIECSREASELVVPGGGATIGRRPAQEATRCSRPDLHVGQGVVRRVEQVGDVLLVGDHVVRRTGEVGVGGADVDVAPVGGRGGPDDAAVGGRAPEHRGGQREVVGAQHDVRSLGGAQCRGTDVALEPQDAVDPRPRRVHDGPRAHRELLTGERGPSPRRPRPGRRRAPARSPRGGWPPARPRGEADSRTSSTSRASSVRAS